ncbi:hypothetical protein HY256_04860, partial [Candidatus Sumerlaeota bacterium]|nr:hypothetical protein [Candidatus Sumerlaeota bacterium]
MGDQPLQLLRARVERAVRPVRASESRKDRIREELYAHLWSICEEEQGKEPDRCVNSNGDAPFSPEVIARAIERFGDSDELRLWLQDSVPEMERVLFVRLPWIHRVEDYLQARFERRQNESAARWAGRLAVLFAVLIGFVCFVVNPLVQLLLKPQPNLRKVFIMGGVMVLLTAVNAFLFILLNSGMHGS